MNGTSSITTAYPLWFVLICIAVGALYSWFLYSKKNPWNKQVNYLLSFLRFASVTIICLLLLDWISDRTTTTTEKPIVIIAIDDSESITANNSEKKLAEINSKLKSLRKELKNANKEVVVTSYSELFTELDSIDYSFPTSNIDNLINRGISSMEGRNLAGVILLTDGNYNQGSSPEFRNYVTPIFPIAIGDTTRKRDLKIQSIGHNKIAYKGNIFPIKLEVQNQGYEGQRTSVQIIQNNKVLDSKEVVFKESFDIQEVLFQISSEQEGIQHYILNVVPLEKESSFENNVKHAYIEVLNSKEKVLCIALTPHPDIKALKAAIESNSNIEFSNHIIERGDQLNLKENYDLIIFHQIPNKLNRGNDLIEKFKADKKPMLFILGNQSNLQKFNSYNQTVVINQKRNQIDEVSPFFNSNFELFQMDNNLKPRLPKYPPLQVPFGDFNTSGSAEIIVKQQVGSVETEKPAILVNIKSENKEGVICGEGIWKWRLGEYQEHQNSNAFDQLIQKTIQLLSAKNDKRKFRVSTSNNEYLDSEPVIFRSETYNEIYEPIYGNKVFIKITHESGASKSYEYTPSEMNSSFSIKGQKEGLYKYTASTKVSGETLYSSGAFVIKKQRLETLDLTANHYLLKKVAQNSGGKFVYPDQIQELVDYFNSDKVVSVLHANTTRDALINEKWIFFLIFGLLAIEWGLRKNKGGY